MQPDWGQFDKQGNTLRKARRCALTGEIILGGAVTARLEDGLYYKLTYSAHRGIKPEQRAEIEAAIRADAAGQPVPQVSVEETPVEEPEAPVEVDGNDFPDGGEDGEKALEGYAIEDVPFETMSIAELRALADDHEVDLTGKRTKAEIIEAIILGSG